MATTTPSKPTKRKSTSAGPRRSVTSAKTTAKTAAKAGGPKSVAETAPAPATPTSPNAPMPAAAASASDDDRLKRPDLIEAVAKRVSLKRSEAKMVFDVVLDEIGKALDASDEVVVPPLGKLMIKKRVEKPGGDMLTVKLKRAEADPAAGDVAPLADPIKDS
ncbi:HU family DNA-binding protein [Jannaschia sp. CCS1]|uniref:HU family DNA-binding protein n=1 Tax=Jannaschia sp. (strain CCS1) TaxID=290400 RepID=UPI0002D8AE33|nr:HU family DNA-binding protein [Jannaschia sp. CCS1]